MRAINVEEAVEATGTMQGGSKNRKLRAGIFTEVFFTRGMMALQRNLRKEKVKMMAEKHFSTKVKRGKLQEKIIANTEELSESPMCKKTGKQAVRLSYCCTL